MLDFLFSKLLDIKTSLLISLFVFILFGCKKTEDPPDYKIVNGLYGGQFHYQGIDYGYGVTLDSNRYKEADPGSLYYKKWSNCITAGTYSIEQNKLVFEFDSFIYDFDPTVYPCDPEDWLLPGEYTIDNLDNDSLVFEKGGGDSLIIYYLKREVDVVH